MSQTYCVVDIEATGGNHRSGRIIEVGMVRVHNQKVVSEYSTLINPLQPIDKYVSKLTGITDDDLKGAPEFHEVANEMLDFLGDSVFVAHNATFDYTYLRTEFKRFGLNYSADQVCTLDISRVLFPEEESYSLGKLCNSLGLVVEARHRALGDALTTAQLLIKCLGHEGGNKVLEDVIREKSLDNDKHIGQVAISDNLSSNLPDEPGIFYFKGKNGRVLYIGRGESVKRSAQKLLSGSKKYERFSNHLSDINSIEFERTGNELVAELKYYEKVLTQRPPLNIHLKQMEYRYAISVFKRNSKVFLGITRVRDKAGVVVSYFKDYKSAEKQMMHMMERYSLDPAQVREGLQSFKRKKRESIRLNEKWAKEAPFRYLVRDRRKLMPSGLFFGSGIKANTKVIFKIEKGVFRGYTTAEEAALKNGGIKDLVFEGIAVAGVEKICWHYFRETNHYHILKI